MVSKAFVDERGIQKTEKIISKHEKDTSDGTKGPMVPTVVSAQDGVHRTDANGKANTSLPLASTSKKENPFYPVHTVEPPAADPKAVNKKKTNGFNQIPPTYNFNQNVMTGRGDYPPPVSHPPYPYNPSHANSTHKTPPQLDMPLPYPMMQTIPSWNDGGNGMHYQANGNAPNSHSWPHVNSQHIYRPAPPPIITPPTVTNNPTTQQNQQNQNPPQSQTESPTLITPTLTDVLHGKISHSNHAGNAYYRSLLKRNYTTFIKADQNLKQQLVQDVFRDTKRQGGRFLRQDNKSQLWEEMSTEEALESIYKVLTGCAITESQSKKRLRDLSGKENEAAARKEQRLTEDPINLDQCEGSAKQRQDSSSKSEESPCNATKKCEICNGTGIRTQTFSCDREPSSLSAETTEEPRRHLPSPNPATTKNHASKVGNGDINNGEASSLTAWEAHIRVQEQHLGITRNPNATFPERILEIENRLKAKQNHAELIPLNIANDQQIEEILGEAEKKWGVNVPEGYTYAQRIELIEKTAFNFMARLQVWL